MTDATHSPSLASPKFKAPSPALGHRAWLFGPLTDFLILGGGSVIAFVLIALLPGSLTTPQQIVLSLS